METIIINQAKDGNCEKCKRLALLDKGFGKKWLCEICYYEEGADRR